MLKHMLTTSVIALTFGAGSAFAQTQTPAQNESPPAMTEPAMPGEGVPEVMPGSEPGAPGSEAGAVQPAPDGITAATDSAPTFVTQQQDGEWLAAGLIGREVVGPDGEQIGEVVDLVIGPDGTTQAVLIGVGGFLGLGERTVAVDFDTVRTIDDGTGAPRLMIAASVDLLEQAPEYLTLEAQRADEEYQRRLQESEQGATPEPQPQDGGTAQ